MLGLYPVVAAKALVAIDAKARKFAARRNRLGCFMAWKLGLPEDAGKRCILPQSIWGVKPTFRKIIVYLRKGGEFSGGGKGGFRDEVSLVTPEGGVFTIVGKQFGMGAAFHNATLLEENNLVGISHGGQTMSDYKRGT